MIIIDDPFQDTPLQNQQTRLALLRVRYALAFLRALQDKRVDGKSIWSNAGFAPEVLEDPEACMPMQDLFHFLDKAVELTGYHTLGLDAGIAQRLQHSEFSLKLLLAPSLFETLSSVCRYAAEEDTSTRWRLVREGRMFWIQTERMQGIEAGIRQVEFYRYSSMLEIIRFAAGPNWLPASVDFQTGPVCGAVESEFLAGVDVRFGRPFMRVAIPPLLLSRSLHNIPDAPLKRSRFSERPDSFQDGLLEVLRYQVLSGKGQLEEAAKAMGLSKRTLQRRLSDQRVTYSRSHQYVKMDTAREWLADGDKPIAEIAARLGYRECTNFSRAFRKMNGLTPREFRRLINNQSGQ